MAGSTLLDTKSAIEMVDNDLSLYKILLRSFLSETPFNPEKLRSLLKNNDSTEAAKYVHRTKGAAAQLGAKQLASDGEQLEKVLRGKIPGDKTSLADRFIDTYGQTVPLMEQVLFSV